MGLFGLITEEEEIYDPLSRSTPPQHQPPPPLPHLLTRILSLSLSPASAVAFFFMLYSDLLHYLYTVYIMYIMSDMFVFITIFVFSLSGFETPRHNFIVKNSEADAD